MVLKWKFGKESTETIKFSPFSANFPVGTTFRVGESLNQDDVEEYAKIADTLISENFLTLDRLISLSESSESKEDFLKFLRLSKQIQEICMKLEAKNLLPEEIDSVKENLGLVDVYYLWDSLKRKLEEENIDSNLYTK